MNSRQALNSEMARDSRICDNDKRKILIFFPRNPTFWGCDSEGRKFIAPGIVYKLLFFSVGTVQSFCITSLARVIPLAR